MTKEAKEVATVETPPEKRDIQLGKRGLELNTLEELTRFAGFVAHSEFAPPQYKGKPHEILIAIQMGRELGFAPMTSLQNIAVINGRPTIWGDMAKALVMDSGHCQEFKEYMKGSIRDGDAVAYCEVTRKGMEPFMSTFSIDDAKLAGLWDRRGPWTQYPKRMLQMRARGFAIRDVFPDALKGLCVREEVEDYHKDEPTAPKSLDDIAAEMEQS